MGRPVFLVRGPGLLEGTVVQLCSTSLKNRGWAKAPSLRKGCGKFFFIRRKDGDCVLPSLKDRKTGRVLALGIELVPQTICGP